MLNFHFRIFVRLPVWEARTNDERVWFLAKLNVIISKKVKSVSTYCQHAVASYNSLSLWSPVFNTKFGDDHVHTASLDLLMIVARAAVAAWYPIPSGSLSGAHVLFLNSPQSNIKWASQKTYYCFLSYKWHRIAHHLHVLSKVGRAWCVWSC